MSYFIGGGVSTVILIVALGILYILYKCRPRCDNCHHNFIVKGICKWPGCGSVYPMTEAKRKCEKVDRSQPKAA